MQSLRGTSCLLFEMQNVISGIESGKAGKELYSVERKMFKDAEE